jgi:nucleotide-binding universal stress UspA family protein
MQRSDPAGTRSTTDTRTTDTRTTDTRTTDTRSWSDMTRPELPPIERVVVPVDLDEDRRGAARWAATVAESLGATTRYLVADRYSTSERPEYRRELEELATIEQARGWFETLGVVPGEIEMVVGDPNDRVDAAVDERAIVVVGSDEVEGVTPFAFGATARDLASRLDCPVVAVPPASDASDGPIVVGVSGRSSDEIRSLAWAAAVGHALGRDVVAVHAVDAMYRTFDNAGDFGEDDRLAREMARRAGVSYLHGFGDPVDVCRSTVEDLDASLLVVSAKHRRSLGGRLLGRVADAFIHEPPVPVAIITSDYTDAESTPT